MTITNFDNKALIDTPLMLSIEFDDDINQTIKKQYSESFMQNIWAHTYHFLQKHAVFLPNSVLNFYQKTHLLEIFIVNKTHAQQLNYHARGKDYATNILSYHHNLTDDAFSPLPYLPIGELVICADVVEYEARTAHKTTSAHLAHLLVHGILHLLGFDHKKDDEAAIMQALETNILATLNVDNPYIID